MATLMLHGPHSVFMGTYFLDAPMWGGAMLALSFLSLASINWFGRGTYLVSATNIVAFFGGLYCVVQTGERGTWLTVPVAGAIFVFYRLTTPYRIVTILLSVVACISVYLLVPNVPIRLALTGTEVTKALNGDLDTSIGKRLQIWRAAGDVILTHPIAGIGSEGVRDELREMSARGWFTAGGLKAALSQIHNEIIANTLRLGLPGLASILCLYLVPLVIFVNAMRSRDRLAANAGLLGAMFVTTYLVLGISNETFNLKMLASFYAVTVAVLLAVTQNAAADRA
jgi:O-antigen ligase